jgi:hypothetical protein
VTVDIALQIEKTRRRRLRMAKKKGSLRGKGPSILLGKDSPESLPQPPSEGDKSAEASVPAAPEPQEEEAVDWSAMLEDEVATAEPPKEEGGMPVIKQYYTEDLSAEPEPRPLIIEEVYIEEPSPSSIGSVAPPTPVVAEVELGELGMPLEVGEGGPGEAYGPTEPEEVDWSPMMEDEVTTAESPAEEMGLPPIEHYYPPEEPDLPESELPPVEEMAVSTPSSTVVAQPQGPPASPGAEQPPSSVPTSAPQIRLGGLLAGTSLEGEVAPPGPGFGEVKVRETTKAPPKELTEDEEEIVIGRVSRKQRQELYELISELYRNVPMKLAASGLQARKGEALLLLSEARDIVLEDPRQFDEAEYKVWQVQGIIANAENVEKWSHHYGNRLIAYLSVWFALFMASIVFFGPLSEWLEEVTLSATLTGTPPIQVPPLLFTMVWGGIGGVIGGFYSLWRHIAEEQDFDKQYTVWYTLQPIMGLVLGGIIHIFVLAGFLSMFSQVSSADVSLAKESQAVQAFPALLAVVAGFRPNFVYALISQVVKLIGRQEEE